jgi:hypothetical protein
MKFESQYNRHEIADGNRGSASLGSKRITAKHKLMKTSEVQTIASTKTYLLSMLMVIFFCYVVPFGSVLVKEIGAALLFTASFWFWPDSFRSRNGSLIPAFCLTAFVWLSVAVTIVLTFFGVIEL